jgi:hypothetical protein
MRSGYLPTLFLGLAIVYLGIFGLNGFGVAFQLSGGMFKEDFNSIGSWTVQSGIPQISPAGQLLLFASAGGQASIACQNKFIDVPSQFTVQIAFSIDSIGSGGRIEIRIYPSTTGYYVPFIIWADGSIVLSRSLGTTTIDSSRHAWTLLVDHTAGYPVGGVRVYKDLTALGLSDWQSPGSYTNRMEITVYGGSGTTTVHFDNIYFDSGLIAPTADDIAPHDGSSTGSLLATCRKNGVNLAGATITIAGKTSNPTASDGIVTIPNIPAGTYSAVASASGLTSVSMDVTITAGVQATQTFEFATGIIVTVTPQPGSNGQITPSGPTQIGYSGDGSSKTFTVTANNGFYIEAIALGAEAIAFPAKATSYTVTVSTTNVQTSRYLYATFASGSSSTSWTIVVVQPGSGGSIAPAGTAGTVSVPAGQAQTMTVTINNPSFTISTVTVDGSAGPTPYTSPYTYTFPAGTTGSHTFSATVSQGGATTSFTIHASAGDHGSITPSGAVPVLSGGSQQFVIMADTGYKISSISVDNSPYSFTSGATSVNYNGFTSVVADHTISAAFSAISPGESPAPSSGPQTSPEIPQINFNIDWSSIATNINAMINANRQPLIMIGGLIALVSFLCFLLPAKRIPFSF